MLARPSYCHSIMSQELWRLVAVSGGLRYLSQGGTAAGESSQTLIDRRVTGISWSSTSCIKRWTSPVENYALPFQEVSVNRGGGRGVGQNKGR